LRGDANLSGDMDRYPSSVCEGRVIPSGHLLADRHEPIISGSAPEVQHECSERIGRSQGRIAT
jgi:hypothetical protein